jgi:hypothetical protein
MQLGVEGVRRLRARAQGLGPVRFEGGVASVVRVLCGVQAQDVGAAPLAIRVRSVGLVAEDVERALAQERSIVRTWAMRGTLHYLAAEDVGWILALLGPGFAASGKRRRAELGLDDTASARGVKIIRDTLAEHGPLTRAQISEHLERHGLPSTGQAPVHLIALASLQGLVCHGPERGGKPTYVLLSDWIEPGEEMPRVRAVEELAHRYLAAYAPASVEDYAAWSGLPLGDVRPAWKRIESEMVEVEVEGKAAWMVRKQEAWLDAGLEGQSVRLVPSFDTYLLGYRSREFMLAPENTRRIHPGGGILHPAVVVDGWVSGTWRLKRKGQRVEVAVSRFDEGASGTPFEAALEQEAADIGRFLGVKATLAAGE